LQKDGYFVGHVGKWQFYSDNNRDLIGQSFTKAFTDIH